MAAKNIYHHGDLSQKIIGEALCKIEENNIASLSLREIARHIGVSHNAFYRHFPNKESLLVAIAEIGFRQLRQALQQALFNSSDDARQKVETLSIAYIQYAVKNQAYYQVMFSDCLRNNPKYSILKQLAEEAFEIWLSVIKVGQKTKVFVSEDSQELACVCWSLVHGVSMLAVNGQLMASNRDAKLESELAQIATRVLSRGLCSQND